MTRRKVKLEWIANDSARRLSLKKRRLGLLKKVSELATLCDIKACIIIYSPDESEPLVWPSHSEVRQHIEEFHEVPELERMKKMMNQETYLREKSTKVQQQVRKSILKNKEFEMNRLMHQIHDQGKRLDELSPVEMQGLVWFMEEKMKETRKRLEFFEQFPFAQPAGHTHGDLPLPFQGPTDDLAGRVSSGSAGFEGHRGRNTAESLLSDQWFIDMFNNNELNTAARSSSLRGDMGLPCHPFASTDLGLPGHSLGGNSSVAAKMGQSQYGDFIGSTTDMGLPPLGFRPHGGASTDLMGLPTGSVRSSNFGSFGSDIGQGLHPFGHIGSSSVGPELGQPFAPFGGASNSGASGDIGLPFHEQTWPANFSP